jgi:cell division septum initiation protein DivIVA
MILKQSVIECLDRMERTIESSRKMLFSSSRIVDGVELLELIDRIRIALPEEIRQAEALQSERSRIAAESGRVEAGPSGQAQASGGVTARAREEAEAILAQARREAFEIRAGADEYAESTLSSLQETLDRTSFVVRKGIDELKRRKNDPD